MNSIESHLNGYLFTQDEKELAREISERLSDWESVGPYLNYAKEVSHQVLRKELDYVCSLPERKISTSRVAYFVFLIERHKRRLINENAANARYNRD